MLQTQTFGPLGVANFGPLDILDVVNSELWTFGCCKIWDVTNFGPLDLWMLKLWPLDILDTLGAGTFGPLDTLTFGPLDMLHTFGARTFGPLDTLTFGPLDILDVANSVLAFNFGPLDILDVASSDLWTFGCCSILDVANLGPLDVANSDLWIFWMLQNSDLT